MSASELLEVVLVGRSYEKRDMKSLPWIMINNEQKKFLLADCVQAYLPLDAAQQREFERLASGPGYEGVKAMNKTWYDKGLEEGQRTILREQLEERFGPLPASVRQKLDVLSADEIRRLSKAVLRAQSLYELGLATQPDVQAIAEQSSADE